MVAAACVQGQPPEHLEVPEVVVTPPILAWDPESESYKVPHTDGNGNALAMCGHIEYNDNHCSEMNCFNYISKHMH
jgi:hypothetical protein